MSRVLLLLGLLVGACHSTASPLHRDLTVFCGPAMQERLGPPNLWGPWLEPQLESVEMKSLLADIKQGRASIVEVSPRVRELMQRDGLATCATLDLLDRPDPSKAAAGRLEAAPVADAGVSAMCAGAPCQAPASCIRVSGMQPNSSHEECVISCASSACPTGMHCVMISDGAGKVCEPGPASD